jgi:putative membrane protein
MIMGYGYGPGWGMMGGWGGYGGYGYGYGPFGMIIWIVVLITVVALVVWLVRSLAGGGMQNMHHLPPRRSSGLDVLEERYARGEINRDEYLQKKKDIGG